MSDPTTVIVTALTTLFIGLVAAFVGSRLQAGREHAKWLRERRYDVCLLMYRSIDAADYQQKIGLKRPKQLPAPADLYVELQLLGLDSVTVLAGACDETLAAIQAPETEWFGYVEMNAR